MNKNRFNLRNVVAVAICLAGLAANSSAQNSWSYPTAGAKLNPTTANLGIGDDPSAKAKLLLRNSVSSTDTVFGLHSFVENISNLNKPFYGAYFKNKRSSTAQSSSLLYGIYLDNENSTYGNQNYGVYVKNNTGGYSGTTYGFYVDNSTSGYTGTTCGFYANNSGGSTMGSMYGIQLINDKTGTGGGDVFGVHSTNTISASSNSVYGARLSSKHTSTSASASVYGIYSTVEGGAPDKRWAGYFTGGNVAVMQGSVGIETANPSQALTVQGRIAVYPQGTTSEEQCHGNLIITKPASSGQYINLIRQGNYPWSIGTVYNNNTFAIGSAETVDSQFTNPFFTINASGNVGIGLGSTNPQHKLDVAGSIQATDIKTFTVWPGYDPITYDGKSFSNYALKWESDSWASGGRSLWISGWGGMKFFTGGTPRLSIHNNGNVGIGYTNPGAKLDVNGVIRAHEVKVCVNQGCDYVFEDNYNLMNLSDLNNFIKTNKHLPEVAPAVVMESEGINLSEMNTLLLKKVEELTLYVIELNRKIEILENK